MELPPEKETNPYSREGFQQGGPSHLSIFPTPHPLINQQPLAPSSLPSSIQLLVYSVLPPLLIHALAGLSCTQTFAWLVCGWYNFFSFFK